MVHKRLKRSVKRIKHIKHKTKEIIKRVIEKMRRRRKQKKREINVGEVMSVVVPHDVFSRYNKITMPENLPYDIAYSSGFNFGRKKRVSRKRMSRKRKMKSKLSPETLFFRQLYKKISPKLK